MVTIGMNYRVKAGRERVFEDAFERVLQAIREAPGHDSSQLYREVGDGSPVYLIVSRWTGEEAFRSFVSSEAFKKVTNWGLGSILEGPPQHTTYQES